MDIQQFKTMVSTRLEAQLGLSLDDLPDVDLWAFFDEDFDEEDAAVAADDCVGTIKHDLGIIDIG